MSNNQYYSDKTVYGINGARLERIAQLLTEKNMKILDIGCGGGGLARELTKLGHKVSGVDISQSAIDSASDSLVSSYCFDIEHDKWPESLMKEKFDVIIISEVIEHLFSPKEVVQQAKELLNENGYLIITTPNILFWKNRFRIFFGSFEYQKTGIMDYGHIRFFTLKTVKNFINELQLDIVKENHFYPNLYKRHLNWLGNVFSSFFAYQMIFKVKKCQIK